MNKSTDFNLTNQKNIDNIGEQATAKQRLASDPSDSVWVGASAGTGKTKILTDRVLRLLLPKKGQDANSASNADKILCITFTKAAAAEMAIRINDTLSKWAVIDEKELEEQLSTLLGYFPDKNTKKIARRLFAQVVDINGGMKIMTIHSFCQSVLKRFPLEAKLSPNFEVIDEITAEEYLSICKKDMINELDKNPDGAISSAFKVLEPYLTDGEHVDTLLQELTKNRSKLSYLIKTEGGEENLIKNIYKLLDVKITDTVEDIIKNHKVNDLIFTDIYEILKNSDKSNDNKKAQFIPAFAQEKNEDNFRIYMRAFLTGKNEIYAKPATKDCINKMPDILDIMNAEAQNILNSYNKIQSVNIAKITAEIIKIGAYIIKKYNKYKQLHSLLDYDDLIYYTRDLLGEFSSAAWVLYKLDGGIEHILVDEAQDTNPDQWRVISSLTEEFFAGYGIAEDAKDINRTLFIVGDEKQSIFSFQGADPAEFANMQDYFAKKVMQANKNWKKIDLDVSFRSSPEILEFVDNIFQNKENQAGVVFDTNSKILHRAFKKHISGLVELWPLCTTNKEEQEELLTSWDMPTQIKQIKKSDKILAEKIADKIKFWLDSGEELIGRNRVIKPKDIMILVRKRNVFLEHCIKALKDRNIAVAGIDRMVLNEQMVIKDMVSMLKFALLPEDDLNLATILKNPLLDITEEELLELCTNRAGTLWEELKNNNNHFKIKEYLQEVTSVSIDATPYDFFSYLLNHPCPTSSISGKYAILTRLGRDALDPIEELLNSCLIYAQQHNISMQGFLNWFAKGKKEIKREQEQDNTNQVRIMTVHASKGLQAPIVFLPDTTSIPRPYAKNQDKIVWKKNKIKKIEYPLWSPLKEVDDVNYTNCKNENAKKQLDEYKRLLYVAITRAEDRLYICGYSNNEKKLPENCWYLILKNSLEKLVKRNETDDILTFYTKEKYLNHNAKKIKDKQDNKPNIPSWCYQNPMAEPTPPKPLVPSLPKEQTPAVISPINRNNKDEKYFLRGKIIHKLLEIIPNIREKSAQYLAIRTFLAKNSYKLSKEEQSNIFNEIINIIENEEFAPIFSKNSIAEMPFHGLIEEKVNGELFAVTGIIDRIVITKNNIYIIDYKTNRIPPKNIADIPSQYIKQMQMYKETLKKIYPKRTIKTALLWTSVPKLTILNI